LYAFWGAAPAEIIQYLLKSYQLLYPGHLFNWTNIVETMGRCDTPNERFENLLAVKQMHLPEQPLDWEYLLNVFVTMPTQFHLNEVLFQEHMCFLFMCGVEALAFKVWRDHIKYVIQTADFKCNGDNSVILYGIQYRLLPTLKANSHN
jgi:hypothetical protein